MHAEALEAPMKSHISALMSPDEFACMCKVQTLIQSSVSSCRLCRPDLIQITLLTLIGRRTSMGISDLSREVSLISNHLCKHGSALACQMSYVLTLFVSADALQSP